MQDKYQILKECFGYTSFRNGQEALIDALLVGRDVFGIMPEGKTLCYQIPAVILEGLTVVISPLASRMNDRVAELTSKGVPAACIHSSLNSIQREKVLTNIRRKRYKLIYVDPERLLTPEFFSAVYTQKLSLVAIEDAHCISQLSQDFRSGYLQVTALLKLIKPRPVVAAFSATVTQAVREDVERILHMEEPLRMITGFDRPGLQYEVIHPRNKAAALQALVNARKEKSGIVYCATEIDAQKVCQMLQSKGLHAACCHPDSEEAEHNSNRDAFACRSQRILVATHAFDPEIGRPQVDYVIHYNIPHSMEEYYREASRASTDGAPAECILIFSKTDITTARALIRQTIQNAPEKLRRERIRRELERLNAMVEYCVTDRCLQEYILEYFGQPASQKCGSCSNCTAKMHV